VLSSSGHDFKGGSLSETQVKRKKGTLFSWGEPRNLGRGKEKKNSISPTFLKKRGAPSERQHSAVALTKEKKKRGLLQFLGSLGEEKGGGERDAGSCLKKKKRSGEVVHQK